MPTIPEPKPLIPEGYSAEQESVFDPLYETLLKRATRTTGMDDPNTSWQSLMNPTVPVAGLISKVPFDKVARRNVALLEMLKAMGASPETMQAAEFASKKYPRILAHVDNVFEVPESLSGEGVLGFQSRKPIGTSEIQVDPRQIKKHVKGDQGRNVARTFGHELTHAAQHLWNQQSLGAPYDALTKSYGYHDNIFEEGARKAGQNFSDKLYGSVKEEPSMIQKLLDMFNLNK